MQNSPQFVIGYYAILRANAVVVPINPMLTAEELEFYVRDCEIKTALLGQELYDRVQPLLGPTTLENLIIAAYSEYKGNEFDGMLPPEVEMERMVFTQPNHTSWWMQSRQISLLVNTLPKVMTSLSYRIHQAQPACQKDVCIRTGQYKRTQLVPIIGLGQHLTQSI